MTVDFLKACRDVDEIKKCPISKQDLQDFMYSEKFMYQNNRDKYENGLCQHLESNISETEAILLSCVKNANNFKISTNKRFVFQVREMSPSKVHFISSRFLDLLLYKQCLNYDGHSTLNKIMVRVCRLIICLTSYLINYLIITLLLRLFGITYNDNAVFMIAVLIQFLFVYYKVSLLDCFSQTSSEIGIKKNNSYSSIGFIIASSLFAVFKTVVAYIEFIDRAIYNVFKIMNIKVIYFDRHSIRKYFKYLLYLFKISEDRALETIYYIDFMALKI